MKTTIDICDELLILAKRRARERGVTLKSLIEAGLRQAVLEDERREAQPPYRLPVIRDALQLTTTDDDVNALLGRMTGSPKPIKPTNPSHEAEAGRLALWLDLEDLRWLASNCGCTDVNLDHVEERCGRVRFRANAALHKAGLKGIPINGTEAQ